MSLKQNSKDYDLWVNRAAGHINRKARYVFLPQTPLKEFVKFIYKFVMETLWAPWVSEQSKCDLFTNIFIDSRKKIENDVIRIKFEKYTSDDIEAMYDLLKEACETGFREKRKGCKWW